MTKYSKFLKSNIVEAADKNLFGFVHNFDEVFATYANPFTDLKNFRFPKDGETRDAVIQAQHMELRKIYNQCIMDVGQKNANTLVRNAVIEIGTEYRDIRSEVMGDACAQFNYALKHNPSKVEQNKKVLMAHVQKMEKVHETFACIVGQIGAATEAYGAKSTSNTNNFFRLPLYSVPAGEEWLQLKKHDFIRELEREETRRALANQGYKAVQKAARPEDDKEGHLFASTVEALRNTPFGAKQWDLMLNSCREVMLDEDGKEAYTIVHVRKGKVKKVPKLSKFPNAKRLELMMNYDKSTMAKQTHVMSAYHLIEALLKNGYSWYFSQSMYYASRIDYIEKQLEGAFIKTRTGEGMIIKGSTKGQEMHDASDAERKELDKAFDDLQVDFADFEKVVLPFLDKWRVYCAHREVAYATYLPEGADPSETIRYGKDRADAIIMQKRELRMAQYARLTREQATQAMERDLKDWTFEALRAVSLGGDDA